MDLDTARVVIPVVVSAFVAIVVASIGFTSAIVVMRRTLRNQRDMEVLRDARALRDSKRERLRLSFEPVLLTAVTVRDIVHERRFLFGNETEAERDARLQEALVKAVADIDHTRVRLLLETNGTRIVDKLDEIHKAFATVLMLQQARRHDPATTISWQRIQEEEQQVEAGARELESVMRGELAKLEKPMAELPQGSTSA